MGASYRGGTDSDPVIDVGLGVYGGVIHSYHGCVVMRWMVASV